jgi:hypothetical protein
MAAGFQLTEMIKTGIYCCKSKFTGILEHVIPVVFTYVVLIQTFKFYQSPLQIIILFAIIFTIVAMWYENHSNTFSHLLWGIYDICTGLYILAIGELIHVILKVIKDYNELDDEEFDFN